MKTVSIILSILFALSFAGSAQQQPLVIKKLTGDYYVFTTWRTYQGTPFPSNGMYLVTNAGAVLIDCPWDTTQLQPLLDSIKAKHNKEVVVHIATHSHSDRSAGLEYYTRKGIKTYSTVQTDSFSVARKEKRAKYLLTKDSIFQVGQYRFQTFYPGPGHTVDNIVVWFGEQKVLYGGCFVKSTEAEDLGNLADANTKAWPSSIQNILKKFGEPKYVITGHQDWSNNKSLQHTLMLLKQKNK